MTARSAANANDLRWGFFCGKMRPFCREAAWAAAHGRRLSASPTLGTLGAKPAPAPFEPSQRSASLRLRSRSCSSWLALRARQAHPLTPPSNRQNAQVTSPCCRLRRLSLAAAGCVGEKGLVTRPFPLAPTALAHSLPQRVRSGVQPGTTLCIQSHLGFSHSAKNDPPVAKALPTGGCCVATLFFE